jgi:hypothetical protein
VQHVGNRGEERLIVWVVLVPQPVLDRARRDGGQEGLDAVRGGRRGQPVDIGPGVRRARVAQRAGANVLGHGRAALPGDNEPADREAAEPRRVEAGEVPAVAPGDPGVTRPELTRRHRSFLESAHPVTDVADEQPALGDLAVVDDVDARGHLPGDDVRDRAWQRRVEGLPLAGTGVEEPLQRLGPRQHPGV